MEIATAPPETQNGAIEDDGLAVDPNSEEASGVPGGRQPGDDGYVPPPADLPDDGAQGEEDEQPQLFVLGDKELGLKVSGRKPDSAALKLKGAKIDLGGQFDRGDRFVAALTLQITGDNDQDTIETATGVVKSTSKAQSATVCGAGRLEDYLLMKLDGHPELLAAVLKALELPNPSED
jgi:hypothetical protein